MSVNNVRIEILKDEAGVGDGRGRDVGFVLPERGAAARHRARGNRRSVPHVQQVMISRDGRGAGLCFFRLSFIEEGVSPCGLIIYVSVLYA